MSFLLCDPGSVDHPKAALANLRQHVCGVCQGPCTKITKAGTFIFVERWNIPRAEKDRKSMECEVELGNGMWSQELEGWQSFDILCVIYVYIILINYIFIYLFIYLFIYTAIYNIL